MTKQELTTAVQVTKKETKTALEIMYKALNQGQQKKLVKDKTVKDLFDVYGVDKEDVIKLINKGSKVNIDNNWAIGTKSVS